MGNCLWGVMSDPETVIKVITSNGGIMEFYPPITVSFITNEFPGHGIFSSHDDDNFRKPLCQFDELVAGQSYNLLPLDNQADYYSSASATAAGGGGNHSVRQGHVRSRSVPTISHPAPYRMSLDYQYYQGVGLLKRTTTESLSCRSTNTSNNSSGNNNSTTTSRSMGFWKVKLMITPEQLVDILSQEARTKELIESVRIVAKCGVAAAAAAGGSISSAASMVSDKWSLSSSGRSAPSKIDALEVDI